MAASLTKKARNHLHDIPVSALNYLTRNILSNFLNVENPLVNISCGCLVDYRGVAQCRGFDYYSIERFRRSSDPMGEILEDWNKTTFHQPDDPSTRSVQSLLDILEYLGREDVLYDLDKLKCLENDVRLYRDQVEALRCREQARRNAICPPQVPEISSTSENPATEDFHRYTVEDAHNNRITYYDAAVLFCDDPTDLAARFVHSMITHLEPKVKLFIPSRDLLGGGYRGKVSCELIEKRCRRLVIIVTNGYMQSKECEFQTQYAHCLSPGATGKKILPVRLEDCPLEGVLKPITPIDFCRPDCRVWFWDRLYASIKSPLRLTKDEKRPRDDFNSIQELDISIKSTITGTDYRELFEDASALPSLPPTSSDFEMILPAEQSEIESQQCSHGRDSMFCNSCLQKPRKRMFLGLFELPKIGKKQKEKM
ncbi:myeloid differentiation primary response protein MyD88-like [Tubulanus polymorphus]|uniref:myeloid differentiation primary response protein MyD88-like n=1 Tax=Tubulanus polymorphus TaxID=672921 RepID=UPI003DA3744B